MTAEELAGSPSAQALAAGGLFDAAIDGFRPRHAQQQMASRVETALADGGVLIAESGTGTGKTYAYLVPALLSIKKTIIATGTRHLQDQIYRKDLPAVQKLLGAPRKTALLKGRANYLCLHRLDMADTALFMRPSDVDDLNKVRQWAMSTRVGDIAEVAGVADDASVWPMVTSTAENCLGSKCPALDDCHVIKARRSAASADLLVVNHHLFFSDLALKDTGFGEVLPGHEAVIFDEAHQIPEIASRFFGESFSTGQIRSLCREAQVAEAADKSGVDLDPGIRTLEKAAMTVNLCAEGQERGDLEVLNQEGKLTAALDGLQEALQKMEIILGSAATAGDNLAAVHERCHVLASSIECFRFAEERNMIYWFEKGKQFLRLEATPVSIEGLFQDRLITQNISLVFTSATLTSDSQASHFRRTLGLGDVDVGIWPSPFPYAERALMYVPEQMPEPASPEFASKMLEAVLPVVRTTRGRAFLLFTSYRMLNEVHERLQAEDDFELLIQGETPKHLLIEQFRETEKALLLGTSSFWEGVDVQGDQLVCVVIDKLPFASPYDPVQRARLKHIEEQGGNAFWELQLPNAIIALKQGAGRLIRDEQDYGVLMICDPRIKTKGYGKQFLEALPSMRKTSRLELVERFINYMEQEVTD